MDLQATQYLITMKNLEMYMQNICCNLMSSIDSPLWCIPQGLGEHTLLVSGQGYFPVMNFIFGTGYFSSVRVRNPSFVSFNSLPHCKTVERNLRFFGPNKTIKNLLEAPTKILLVMWLLVSQKLPSCRNIFRYPHLTYVETSMIVDKSEHGSKLYLSQSILIKLLLILAGGGGQYT